MAKQKEQTPFKTVTAQVKYYLSLYDKNVTWLAKSLGVSQSTMYSKMKDPKSFTLEDIAKISTVFNVDTEKFGVMMA